jgi:hypothetical protein
MGSCDKGTVTLHHRVEEMAVFMKSWFQWWLFPAHLPVTVLSLFSVSTVLEVTPGDLALEHMGQLSAHKLEPLLLIQGGFHSCKQRNSDQHIVSTVQITKPVNFRKKHTTTKDIQFIEIKERL